MTVAMLLAAMLAAPAQSAPATVANAATITPGGPVRGAFFALTDLDFFARVPLLMRIDVLLGETSDQRSKANRVPCRRRGAAPRKPR